MVDIPLVALGVQPMKDPFGTYAKSYAQGIELDNKIATQDAQRRFQEGDQSALRDMMVRDPDNAARLGSGITALQSYEDQQFQREYNMASGFLGMMSKAESTQKPLLWDSYMAMAQQQGMQIPPQLQGGYAPEKEQFLSQQLEMSKMRMMGGGAGGFKGTGFDNQLANMKAQQYIAQGIPPQQAYLMAGNDVFVAKQNWSTDEYGRRQAAPANQSILGSGMQAPQPPVATPTPQPSALGSPAPQQVPVQSLTPTAAIDAGEVPAQGFNNVIGAPGYVELPPKPPVLSTVPNAPETMQAQPGESLDAEGVPLRFSQYPGARAKFLESQATQLGSGASTDAAKKEKGQKGLDVTIKDMIKSYQKLDELGETVRTDKPMGENLINTLKGSSNPKVLGMEIPVGGQELTGAVGTRGASERQNIGAAISSVLLDLKPATEAGARSFDSDQDVKMMREQASNPTNTLESNLRTLERLSKKYGTNSIDFNQTRLELGIPGATKNGYEYLGGDKSKPSSWKKLK